MINMIIMLILLVICAVSDIWTKKLSLWLIGAMGVAGVVSDIVEGSFEWSEAFIGMAVGVVIIFVSILTRGQIGLGDGFLFVAIGGVLGSDSISLFVGALFLCFIVSAVLLLTGQVKRKDRIPFVPFVLLAYIGQLFLQNM